jgi:hypothetical protein
MNRLKKLFGTTVYVEVDILTGTLVLVLMSLGVSALINVLIGG